jgi:DNA-binding NtrC family response regulator
LEADDCRRFGVIGSLLNAMEPMSMAWQIRALWERHLFQFERGARAASGQSVLIVDPDAQQRAAVHFAFKANRFDAVSEADGYAGAFGALHAGSIDLLVVNPPVEGNDCGEFMRRAFAGGVRNFILIAGASTVRNAATEQAALAHGLTVLGCLKKPFTMEQLRLLLARHARSDSAM